jgi:hypothetical protein
MRTTRHATALALVLAASIAACNSAAAPTEPSLEPSVPAAPSASLVSEAPVISAEPSPTSVEPSAASSASAEASASPGSGAAAACTGSDANRDFFAEAAQALDWAVYCPVLPAGWFVDTGEYTLRNGGLLHIEYKGPAGARLEVTERGPCDVADRCAPEGQVLGDAAFGDRPASLVAAEDDHLVIATADESGEWWAAGLGLEPGTFTEIVADFALVSD